MELSITSGLTDFSTGSPPDLPAKVLASQFVRTIACIAWLALSLGGSAYAKNSTIDLRFPSDANTLLAEATHMLEKKISLLSKGRLSTKVAPFDSQEFRNEDFRNMLRKSGAGISILPFHELRRFDAKHFDLFELPYVFRDRNDVYRTFDGPIGNQLLLSLKDKGWVGLALWDGTFIQITSNKPITVVADLKGLKIRNSTTQLAQATATILGSSPTQLQFAEVNTALTRGSIDGAELSLSTIATWKIYEAQQYVNLTNQSYRGYVVVIDQKSWGELSEPNRAALEAAIFETTAIQRKAAEDRDNQIVRALEGKVKFISYNNETYHGFSKAVQPLYAQFLPEYGPASVRTISTARNINGNRPTVGVSYKVWYGTNRRSTQSADGSLSFSNVDDRSLHTGTLTVHIPRYHTFGTIDSSFPDPDALSTDSSSAMKLQRVNPISDQDFSTKVREFIESKPEKDQYALVYVHGYNNSFEEAAMRAAQLGTDLKIHGVMAMYSWPSAGSLFGYMDDERLVETSTKHLEDFLVRVAKDTKVKTVHIIAHSMGNRALLSAISSAAFRSKRVGVNIGQIISAAPDVETEDFKARALEFPKVSTRTTLYNSSKDLALKVSQFKHADNRAGYADPPLVMKGIETVDVSNIDVTLLGHGYYAEAAPVLYDLVMVIKANMDPEDRPRLNRSTDKAYWEIGK